MGEDRENIQVDEDEALRAATASEDVEGHSLPLEEREQVASGDEVEGHVLVSENITAENITAENISAE